MPPSNKYLQLLDQGLSAFVYERDENDQPVLGDNPLMLAPWRDDLPDFIQSKNPALSSLIKRGLLLDTSGGIIFSSLSQATDYYHNKLPSHTFDAPATTVYSRPASVIAEHAACRTKLDRRCDVQSVPDSST